jgi:hypothetical protein
VLARIDAALTELGHASDFERCNFITGFPDQRPEG